MGVIVSEYVDVKMRAAELGCEKPIGLALLPINFDTAADSEHLLNSEATPTVRTLFRLAGISITRIDTREQPITEQHDKSLEWVGPTIFVGASLLSQDPNIVSIGLNILSNFLSDFFKGLPGKQNITLEVVKEDRHGEDYTYRRFHYEGDVEGLRELGELVR